MSDIFDKVSGDIFDTISLEPEQPQGVIEGLVKPMMKAIPKVFGATVGGALAYPISGLAGIAGGITGGLEGAKSAMDYVQSIPQKLITTPEEQKAMENVGLAMKPFEMAGQGWGMIGRATGIPYAEPVLGTMGEASAMFGAGGAPKAARLRVNKAFTGMDVLAPVETPTLKPVPIPESPGPYSKYSPIMAQALKKANERLALPEEKGFEIVGEKPRGFDVVERTPTVEMPYDRLSEIKALEEQRVLAENKGGIGVPPEEPVIEPSSEYKTFIGEKSQWDALHEKPTDVFDRVAPEPIIEKTADPTLYSFPGGLAAWHEKVMGEHLGKAWDKFKGTAFGKTFAEFVNPTSTLPEQSKYLEARYKTLGDIDRAETMGTKIFDSLKGLSDETKKDMFRYLDGQLGIEELPTEVRAKASTLRSVNNMIGRMLVQRDMLPVDTYLKNENRYIRYMYLKHALGDKFDSVGGGGSKMDLSYLKSRKDLTPEQQKAIGFIEDVSIAEPVSVAQPLADMAKNDFFQKISENPNWTFQPSIVEFEGKKYGIGKLREELDIQERINKSTPNVPEIQERLTALRNTMNSAEVEAGKASKNYVMLQGKQYGALDGVMVDRSIARDMKPVYDLPLTIDSKLVDTILDIERKGIATFKVAKTAFNIPTVFRNTISNILQMNMSGTPIYQIPKLMLDAGNVMLEKGTAWKQMQKQGLFKTNWSAAEIQEVMGSIKKWEKSDNLLTKSLDFTKDIAKYYGKIDDFFKAAKYMEQVGSGATKAQAALEAHKWGMDYSLVHPSVKWARRHVMPFISYQYKIAPLIVESIVKRPWVIAKYAAVPELMRQAAKSNLNLTEDDWSKLQKELPLFIKKAGTYAILPWKSKEGNAQWVNFEYFLPWQNFMQIKRDVKSGDVGEVISKDIGIGGPWIDMAVMVKSLHGDTPPEDPFSGRPIYNRLDSPTDKALSMSRWVYERFAPQMLTAGGAAGKTVKAVTGEQDRYGKTVTPSVAAGSWVGLNVASPTKQQVALERKARQKELTSALIRKLVNPTVPKEEKLRSQAEFKKQLKQISE